MDSNVSSDTLRKAQLIQLDILLEFDRLCKEHNLKYQLFAGTLLGAIRHKGFIPWDDDVDVVMLRKDYEKFIEICKHHLKPGYFLQNYKSDPKWYRQFSRLRKDDTKYLQAVYKDIDMHHGIFIDVFPLDKVMPNTAVEAIRCACLFVLSKLNFSRNNEVSPTSSIFKRILGRLGRVTNIILKKPAFDRMETRVMRLFESFDTDYLNHLTNGVTRTRFKRFLMTKKDFEEIVEWEFEGYKFPVSKNYDRLLTNMYGDYMKLPHENERKPHHGIIELTIK